VGAPGIGTVIDARYLLKREIARGGMGVVYEAEHLASAASVAIKLLTAEHAHGSEARQRLLREGQALQQSQHPGVVSALAFGETEHGPFLVMELLEGRPLDGILTVRRKIPVADTVSIGLQLCRALEVVHARGLYHRDIKPGNIFIARDAHGDEVAKLFDFGIARIEVALPKLTMMGAVLGTPEYMAPEQLLARDDIDHRCDIYAVGVTLYEGLTGSVPFEGQFGEVLLKSATQSLPPLRDRCAEVTIELARVIEKALARDPAHRHPDAHAFGHALRNASPYPARLSSLLGRKLDPAARQGSPKDGHLPGGDASLPSLAPTLNPRPGPPPLPASAVTAKHGSPPAVPAAPAASAGDGAPRRRFARAVYVTYVSVIRHDGSTLDARSEDISAGGMLILPKATCQEEEIAAVSFALPMSGRIVELRAVARWIKTARVKQAMGIQFEAVPDDVFAAIERYVAVMGSAES
jgi:serine/threonine protein kinase